MAELDVTPRSTAPEPAPPHPPAPEEPALENGDRLTRCEFERRYAMRPDLKKAQLIEGIVYMPSPVGLVHAEAHSAIHSVLGVYAASTDGVRVAGNATVRLDLENEPQPDVLLCIDATAGGRARVSDGYLESAPELIAEVSASSASGCIDLHDKLRAYRRNGVQEYVRVAVHPADRRIDWFELADGEYRLLPADDAGVVRSRVFPGLHIACPALLAGDLAAALAELQKGIGSDEHRRFIARLAEDA